LDGSCSLSTALPTRHRATPFCDTERVVVHVT